MRDDYYLSEFSMTRTESTFGTSVTEDWNLEVRKCYNKIMYDFLLTLYESIIS